jgi:hypothetical protein
MLPPPTRAGALVRMLFELYAVDGHIQGRLHPDPPDQPVTFCGVLELLAAIEQLDPPPPPQEPANDPRP